MYDRHTAEVASENENLTQSIRPKSEIFGTGLGCRYCTHKNNGAKLNGVRRCDGLREPSFSGRRLGFCTISGPELVWPGGVLRVVATAVLELVDLT